MLERAVARYQIDPEKSFMIGDSPRDIEAAARINIQGLMIPSNSSMIKVINKVI